MKQVALKGAIKLTKDKFDIDQDINQQLEVIKNISNNLFSYLKEGMEVATQQYTHHLIANRLMNQ